MTKVNVVKVKKIIHPLVKGDKSLLCVPKDYDSKKHLPLKAKQFTNLATWLDYQAALLHLRAGQMTIRADNLRKYGDPKKKKAAQKLARLVARKEKILKEIATFEASVNVK